MTPAPPAAFWHRTAAWSLDFAVVGGLATLLAWPRLVAGWTAAHAAGAALVGALQAVLGTSLEHGVAIDSVPARLAGDPQVAAAAALLQSAITALVLSWLVTYAVLGLLYHVGFQCSRWQGSPGQHALGLRVVDASSDRALGLLQAALRYIASALSWLTLNLGHLLAALPPQKRALHDRVSGTRVVMAAGATAALPAWAKAWLWLLAIALLVPLAWLLQRDFSAWQASLG